MAIIVEGVKGQAILAPAKEQTKVKTGIILAVGERGSALENRLNGLLKQAGF